MRFVRRSFGEHMQIEFYRVFGYILPSQNAKTFTITKCSNISYFYRMSEWFLQSAKKFFTLQGVK